jgi:hypothetical protein
VETNFLPNGRIFRQAFAASLVAAGTLAALIFTEDGYGYALDEATYRWVAEESRNWSSGFGDPTLRESISRFRIQNKCHFLEPPGSRPHQPHSNFNLPASIHILNVGWALGGWKDGELPRLRLGSELLFALTLGGIVWRVSVRDGVIPAVGGALGIALCPRVFGHAHLAATETTLVCFWLWAVLMAASLVEDRATIFAAAVALGLLAATKLTAWPACAMILVWVVWQSPGRRIKVAFWMAVGSAAVVYLLTPNLWHDPVGGLKRYLEQASSNPWKIAAYFGGRAYTEGMPWWSGIATLFATTPVFITLLAGCSIPRIRSDRLVSLLWLNVLLLMSMRTGGMVPAHDGERQFLPAMAMLGMLAGLQAGRFAILWSRGRTAASPFLLAIMFALPFAETWVYRRHGLMYYNQLVGGIRVAEKFGFEVSYWFEGMTNEEWKRMLDPLPSGSKVFLRPDHPGVPELVRWGVIPEHVAIVGAPEQAGYFLLYAKKAAYSVPDADGKRMLRTDLADLQARGPAIREVRWNGVRIASLHQR